jgi:hypothetical protein
MRLQIASHNYVRKGRKWLLTTGILGLTTAASAAILPNLFPFLDPTGMISTYNTNGPIDESSSNPFFQSLGTNGRTCGTCHLASDAFGFSVRSIRQKFFRSEGTDPLFAAVDGANCPDNSSDDPAAHSLLLRHGLIRIACRFPQRRNSKSRPIETRMDAPPLPIHRQACKPYRCTATPSPQQICAISARSCLTAAKPFSPSPPPRLFRGTWSRI